MTITDTARRPLDADAWLAWLGVREDLRAAALDAHGSVAACARAGETVMLALAEGGDDAWRDAVAAVNTAVQSCALDGSRRALAALTRLRAFIRENGDLLDDAP